MPVKRWLSLVGKLIAACLLCLVIFGLSLIWRDDFLLSGYSGMVSIVRASQTALKTGAAASMLLTLAALFLIRSFWRRLVVILAALSIGLAVTSVIVVKANGDAFNVFAATIHTKPFLLINPSTDRIPDICESLGPVTRYVVDGKYRYLYVGLWGFALTQTDNGRRFSPCHGWKEPN